MPAKFENQRFGPILKDSYKSANKPIIVHTFLYSYSSYT